ncbi:hypothetical protein KIL84_021038, partial [Mauremys mutica]
MGGSALCLVAVFAFYFPAVSHSQLYSLITPNVLRVESEEKVVVEAHGLSAPIVVTVTVLDFPLKKNILYQVQTDLNPANGMMGTAIIKVSTKDIKKDSKRNQYVVVKAKFPQQTLEKVVLVHFHSGYIFIQTDKTIYTPGSTVLCRIFTVGHRLEPVSKRVIVEYEVRYLYGKTLDGYAFVLFGVKMDDEKRSIPQSLRRISIEDGDGEATLTRAMLQARFVNLNELVGHSLYVSVIVLTESGSDMVEVEKTGINIVTSPYQIHFTKTPKYFKPGMPFELMVYVTNPDGSPAPRVPVQAEGFQSAGPTQGDGTAKLIINMPGDRPQVPITVKTAHPNLPANRQASKSMVAEAYQSQGGSQNYLRLAVTASELKPGDNLLVNFHLTCNNPAVLNQIQYFTYIILNKGKIIRVGRQARRVGQNLVIMYLPITPDLIPSFRIVAYYQVGNSEIVADSVWLDIQDTCMGTLVVNGATERDRRIHEPGTPMKLKLEGDHRAYVGLVAVDKGVYILNKNHKITQSKVEHERCWLISSKTVPFFLKDSITTWEVLAVSLSETKGICVADPYEIKVMKDFFIDLHLPYSVVRNEQVQIRAILYNYREQTIKVRVELLHNPVFCSASTSKAKYRQILDIKAKSSLAVPLVIVPLQLGCHYIEVKAAIWGSFVSDGVRKKLKVVSFESSISKAADYLTQRYQSLTRPYTVALASYALATVGTLNTEKTLMKASTVIDSGIVFGSDFGSSLHGVDAPISHACTIVDVDLDADTYGPVKKPEGAMRSVYIKICIRFLGVVDATMSIIDVSMLTGFSPDVEDLKRVSHTEEECLQFKAHQFFEVGLIQPASVTVYDYYSIEDRCTKFYHPSKQSGLFSKICHGEVCRCAEESCFMQQKIEGPITLNRRMEEACKREVDYAVSQSQIYTLITPNVLRVESEEKVVVEAHGLTTPTEVTITVQDFPLKRLVLYQVKTNLNSDNGMMGTAIIKVPTKDIKKDVKQYVAVQARSPQFNLEKVVLVTFHSGYIFIQTDKTIYTPGSTVYCRIFSVGHQLEPVSKPVIVELHTPEGLIVKRESVSSPSKVGIFPMNHHLPDIVNLGTWSIVARYEDSPQQSFTAQFDIKEYVLPSFEVTLEPSKKFFYIDGNEDLIIHINARFLYGKDLQGTAFVLFGVKIGDEKKSIPQSLKRIEITDGNGEAELTRAMLQNRFVDLRELIGHSIYVTVTVLTQSGSDMVEAERTGINIVTSPYEIHFTKTAKYFKPGMPFELMVYVTNPDGSPAARVPVKVDGSQDSRLTQRDGTAKLVINTPMGQSQLAITVKTDHRDLPENRQARKSMVAKAYKTQGGSQNYLHLAVASTELKPGDNLIVNFHLKTSSQSIVNTNMYFTYLILNKGKIIRAGRQAKQVGQNLVTMSLHITPDLIPSFRIVAYYQVGNSEIVADSVWVDVQDTCMGTLVVKGATEADNRIHKPGSSMKIKVEGDAGARVGLVAVDKGVYVLNKKHKISQTKIWDSVEKSDIGCTPGSGKDNMGVFADAGLSLETSIKISTPQRSEPECPQPAKRRRRSVQLIEYKANKTAEYQDQAVKKCCEDGMYENPMGHSCEKRAGYILDTAECKKAFLDCCNYIKTIRDERQRELQLELSRSHIDEGFLQDEDITSRSHFPESWLWQVEQLPQLPNRDGISSKTLNFYLKDSITTWEVLAVSLSETKGICVADPYEITVMKDFFIDLRLPYSVVRNEQVEIRVILYNYQDDKIKVRMELLHNPALCSASSSKTKYRQILDIEPMSSRAVPLVIVPLELGLHDVEVKAAVWDSYVSDGVKKKLKVVPEGMRVSRTMSAQLDPAAAGGEQMIKVKAPDINDIIPDTVPETKVSITGNPVAQVVENSIDGAKLKHLIVVPYGCVEQNMISLTPTVISTYFLDSTNQWEAMGVNRRAEAINLIRRGYTQQLAYKKPDHSYAAYTRSLSSTWLTAYVAKVFSLASKLVPIQSEVICGAVKWLILEKQKPDGIFQENAPVMSKSMMGGYQGAEPEASLTAFVLVALLESKDICNNQVPTLKNGINKAGEYLARVYPSLRRPYTVALTSYALALMGELDSEKVLMSAST